MEEALANLGYASLVVARPSLLAGDRAATGQPPRLAERFTLGLLAPFARALPNRLRPIDAAQVARALRTACLEGRPGLRTLNSAELQTLAATV